MPQSRLVMLARLSFLTATLIILLLPSAAVAEKRFTITSEPLGARVEINSELFGHTPIDRKMKDHLFNGPKYLWSEFLNVPLQMTISMDGYVSQTIVMTSGPYRWVNLDNSAEKIYYVIKQTSFHVRLQKIGAFLGTNPLSEPKTVAQTASESLSVDSGTKLTVEQLVQSSLPSVVTVQAGASAGSGFIITESGIVVTNRHVVENHTQVGVTTSKGETLQSEAVFVHPTKDLALVKLPKGSYSYLRLADPKSINVGADVIAIGSPGLPGRSEILANTVTKGIVSAFRKSEELGLLLQTDVNINHGNSGGPLLNLRGEVVGVNTLGFREGGATGLNFAILDSEVLDLLKQHFNYVPEYLTNLNTASETAEVHPGKIGSSENAQLKTGNSLSPPAQLQPSPQLATAKAALIITSEPLGAEIYVNGQFDSSTPSKLLLSTGEYTIRVIRPGFKVWERKIKIEIGTEKSLNALLEKEP